VASHHSRPDQTACSAGTHASRSMARRIRPSVQARSERTPSLPPFAANIARVSAIAPSPAPGRCASQDALGSIRQAPVNRSGPQFAGDPYAVGLQEVSMHRIGRFVVCVGVFCLQMPHTSPLTLS
jgi:hypothetical protein